MGNARGLRDVTLAGFGLRIRMEGGMQISMNRLEDLVVELNAAA
jgi:hypothetical protein